MSQVTPDPRWQQLHDQIVGLGERSFRKSYYPQLRHNLDRLERFRTLLDHTPDFVLLLELPEGRIIDANSALGLLVGEKVEALIGRTFLSLRIQESQSVLKTLQRDMQKTSARAPTPHTQITTLDLKGKGIQLELSYGIANVEQQCYGVLVGRDVTERLRNEAMLKQVLTEQQALLDNALVGIVMVRHRMILHCNRRFREMFGYGHRSLEGESMRLLYSDDEMFELAGARAYATQTDTSFSGSLEMKRADGSLFWVEATGRILDPASPQEGSIWIFTDISERKAAESRAHFLAYHDLLTGLPNRSLVQDRLQLAVSAAERNETKLALLILDLDSFKTINDSLGHSAGDRLLIEVTRSLSNALRETDTISRLGGDEFMVLLPDLLEAEQCIHVLDKLRQNLVNPFRIDGHEITVTLSVGIALYPDDGQDLETLQKKADTAMYRAKQSGRNTYRFFNKEMNDEAIDRLAIHSDLQSALARGEFELYYQPQVQIASGQLIGAEALLRWNHPGNGQMLPGRFIPPAEESGLIIPIGAWVLQEACRMAANWQTQNLPDIQVAVNLSALQFKQGDIEATVTQALESSGLDPQRLELELTESILIQDTEKVLATIMRLKQLGVRLSIDDFGTGYSSLAYLKSFKVDKLKIDQSFIRDLAQDPDDAAIVRAIITMARSLGLSTIAEGVEDAVTFHHLRLYHCDEVQGYLLSPPLPAHQFIERYCRIQNPPDMNRS